ncbi:cyclic nucleotide-binding domain-containing protein [Streptomyces sp. Da 82-17]|uniref:cyclic nucleotide-binding domain-containing protein n=1 Tax=Streptomyces sp. Da 82-17 TaxID=3377116 RepID=UPI0038D3EE92
MITAPAPRMSQILSPDHRTTLMAAAREVKIPHSTRLFNEGGRADRFWVVRSGTVALDMRIPGRRPVVIETLGVDDLVGWSWLLRPHVWHLGASAASPVHAWEFDAERVRGLCRDDAVLAEEVTRWVAQVLAHRLQATRTRLLDLYAPYGSGTHE